MHIYLRNLSDLRGACELLQSDFSLDFAIPGDLPFPYQAVDRSGGHAFAEGECEWRASAADRSISGTIYRAGTNGATHVEGELTVRATDSLICVAEGCPRSTTAHFRFNVPL
jgi:hypothetical protein